ncbi:MAG: hypothetical protein ACE5F8_05470, partial [Woeseiaceae bacterium]
MKPSTLASTLACLFAVFLVTACETTGFGGPGVSSGEGRAIRMAQNGDHEAAATAYVSLAARETGDER